MTEEQKQTFVTALRKALAPARLSMDGDAGSRNAYTVIAELKRRGLETTLENILAVIKDVLFDNRLEWDVKPKALLVRESHDKPPVVENQMKAIAAHAEKAKAADKLDAQRRLDGASIEQARAIIAGYLPYKRNQIDRAELEEARTYWNKCLVDAIEANKKTGFNLQGWVKALHADRERRYAEREKISERV